MKRILYSIFIGSLALSFAARGEEAKGKPKQRAAHNTAAAQNNSARTGSRTINHSGQARVQRSASSASSRHSTYHATSRAHSALVVHQSNLQNNRIHTSHVRNVSSNNKVAARNNLTVNRQGTASASRARTANVNSQRNLTVNRRSNVIVNNNWRNGGFNGQQYAAFRNYHREWHNRNWWRSQNDRIIFASGGWYLLNAGYWYPAWGYAPGYDYPYDGPTYGYNNLTPDHVIVNVQEQLQRDGYYRGSLDGVMGPMTRQAIGSFQADHGLAVTSAVDKPTLARLGLV
jgi:hypothetical protein